MIKAIEKCSLQETFGPEVTSTRDLLPKKVNVSSDITIKASHDIGISPVKEHASSNTIPFIATKKGFRAGLFRKLVEKKRKDDHKTPNSIPETTNARGNVPSEVFTNSSNIPALSTYGSGITAFARSNVLGQIPAELWDQQVSYRLRALLFGILADGLLPWLGSRASPMDRHADSLSRYQRPVLLKS